ncbi:hypothetical protein HYFRA_00011192 [Hymenoscyphus fraxineus]|uniref:Uncharacterized protein n=1 Tax=Hymenoscyphus fraxineus TaxID=746836 RepID=A0A9N9L257_9HELO|nr:hypothetical protein HYFRA_00011192 [Hymenoscyphus fraxineus]
MKWTISFAALSALASSALAEDLLFVTNLIGREAQSAKDLGFTTKVVTEAQWRALTTSDFASYKAIIIGDNFGSSNQDNIKFLTDTKNTWGPAVQGNIIIHGADQSNHAKDVLIENSIKFAAAGKALSGASQTGLYFSLSQYYDTIAVSNVDALSYFGTFEVRGKLDCYDKVHIVATSPAIATLTDAYLSNWGCSVHEAFSVYPSVGTNGFQAIAIADGVVFPGTQNYGDGHSGLPYIITRGATPAGCGDGKWDGSIGEECDDGNIVDGDGCSKSCKCESGLPKGDGSCFPKAGNGTAGTNGTIFPTGSIKPTGGIIPSGSVKPSGSVGPSGFFNTSTIYTPTTVIKPTTVLNPTTLVNPTTLIKPTTVLNPTTILKPTTLTSLPPYPITTPPPPYITPGIPTISCIGLEVVVSIYVTELCSTIAPGTTLTSTITSAISTYQKPIYNTQIASMPCYVCALSSQKISYTSFFTATSTYCPACSSPPKPATIYPCASCPGTTLTATCPWATTPVFTQNAVPYTTYSPMIEKPATITYGNGGNAATVTVATTYPAAQSPFCSSCALSTVATSTFGGNFGTVGASPTATGTVQFTGDAGKTAPGGFMAVFALVGAGALGALAVVL